MLNLFANENVGASDSKLIVLFTPVCIFDQGMILLQVGLSQ
jgi:hypothetical protein